MPLVTGARSVPAGGRPPISAMGEGEGGRAARWARVAAAD